MLPRAATKAITGRGSVAALRATWRSPVVRSYAKDNKPPRAVPKSSSHLRAGESSNVEPVTSQGTVKNKTWAPNKPIKFASTPGESPSTKQNVAKDEVIQVAAPTAETLDSHAATFQESSGSSPVVELREPRQAAPERDVGSEMMSTSTENTTQQPIPPRGTESDLAYEAAQPTSQQTQAPSQQAESRAPEESPAQSTPTGPLPDLRQGIPSTFESEYSDRSPSFKTQDSDPATLNVTEDPATGGGRREGDGLPKEAYVSSIERRRNAMARWAYIAFAAFTGTGAFFLGQNWNEEEAKLHPDAPNGWDPSSFWARIKARLSPHLVYYTEPTSPKLLPDSDPAMRPSPYTLVLSLEDLLISSKWSREKGWQVAKRPGVDYFIRYMQQYYELVIFTSVQSMNADMVIRKLDPFHLVSWPLFREATRYINGEHVKDLSYLNRDLSKTLIIDTVADHVQLQPENAILLPKWNGTRNDDHVNDLVALIPFLEYIAGMGMDDVRKVLKSYEGTHIPTEFHRRETLAREAFNKRLAEEKGSRRHLGGASVLGGLSNALGFKPTAPLMQIPGEQSPAEALAQGKMPSDQLRERGLRNYQHIENEIRVNGAAWLKETEEQEKKMQEEQMASMQSGMVGMFGGFFGGGGGQGSAAPPPSSAEGRK